MQHKGGNHVKYIHHWQKTQCNHCDFFAVCFLFWGLDLDPPMLDSKSGSKFSPADPVSSQVLSIVPRDVQCLQVWMNVLLHMFCGCPYWRLVPGSVSVSLWGRDPTGLHSEDVASQSESPVGATLTWSLYMPLLRSTSLLMIRSWYRMIRIQCVFFKLCQWTNQLLMPTSKWKQQHYTS